MLGPMFGFTDDDLVRLRAGAQTPDQHTRISLSGAVLQAVQSGAEDDFTRRVQAFYRRLTALRRMARSVPSDKLSIKGPSATIFENSDLTSISPTFSFPDKAGQYAADALSIALKAFSQEMMKSSLFWFAHNQPHSG